MKGVLYLLGLCGPLVVIAKEDFILVAMNDTGSTCVPLTPLEEIGYGTDDGLNLLTQLKAYRSGEHAARKRPKDSRGLREVQDAQVALELERYLHGLERSFPIVELAPVWYPAKILAELLRNLAEYDLPGYDLVQIAGDLVSHSDILLRRNLGPSGLLLPAGNLTINATAATPTVPAVRLTLDYLETALDMYAQAQTGEVGRQVKALCAG